MPTRALAGRAAGRAAGLAALVIALALGGCASGGTETPMPPVPHTPTTVPGGQSIAGNWQLASGTDGKGAMTLDSDAITLKISGSGAGGKAPCNGYGFHLSSASTGPVVVTRGVATDMACVDPDRMVLEARYLAAFGRVNEAALKDGRLILTGTDVTLQFTKSG
jgi:heat shock protein HslJ